MSTIRRFWRRLRSSVQRRNVGAESQPSRIMPACSQPPPATPSRTVPARSQPPSTAPELHQQSQSDLFSLPPELRLMVYDRVFAIPAPSTIGMIELEDAAKDFPTFSIVMTCKAINIEARDHLKGYKRQWATAAFIISDPYRDDLLQLLKNLPIGAVHASSHIRISGSGHDLEYGADILLKNTGFGLRRDVHPFGVPFKFCYWIEDTRRRLQCRQDLEDSVLDLTLEVLKAELTQTSRAGQLYTFIEALQAKRGI